MATSLTVIVCLVLSCCSHLIEADKDWIQPLWSKDKTLYNAMVDVMEQLDQLQHSIDILYRAIQGDDIATSLNIQRDLDSNSQLENEDSWLGDPFGFDDRFTVPQNTPAVSSTSQHSGTVAIDKKAPESYQGAVYDVNDSGLYRQEKRLMGEENRRSSRIVRLLRQLLENAQQPVEVQGLRAGR